MWTYISSLLSTCVPQILTFETKNPVELAERLRAVCGNQSNAYARLLEYRLNALRGLWGAQRQLALEEQQEREGTGGADEETLALLKRQGLLQQPEQAPFTSRVGLLLVFPLLQSQTRSDPALCGVTAEVLLACLRDCQPLSLSKEPADCLNGLEGLLCSWLEDGAQESGHQQGKAQTQILHTHRQRENAAAALVALACARWGHTFSPLLALVDSVFNNIQQRVISRAATIRRSSKENESATVLIID